MLTTTKHDFVMYERKDAKMKIKDFVLWSLNYHLKKYGEIPTKIVMNRKEIEFLGKHRGVIFQGHKIPVNTVRNCLIYTIHLY